LRRRPAHHAQEPSPRGTADGMTSHSAHHSSLNFHPVAAASCDTAVRLATRHAQRRTRT